MAEKVTLVVVDGPSASGKDALIESLVDGFETRKSHFFRLSEDKLDPDRDAIKKARDMGKRKGGMGDREMAAVITSHRAQIYRRELTRLAQGSSHTTVLANRGLPATLAYQTLRGEVTMDEVWNDHQQQKIPNPDLVVITNCRPETAHIREESRNTIGSGLSGSVTRESGTTADETFRRRRNLHQNFRRVTEFLREKSLPVIELDTDYLTLEEETNIILRQV